MAEPENRAVENTDREIWRETPGDYYAPSIHVTEHGGIGINIGGSVIVMRAEAWHRLGVEHLKNEGRVEFREQLQSLINRNSRENNSNTPDFILAQYLESCLLAFDTAVQQRETWYGRDPRPSKPADIASLDTPTVA